MFAQQFITHAPLFTFDGDERADFFGTSVSGAGDVNGDGLDDLIVGAPEDSGGSARVLSGSDGSVLYNFHADAAGGDFGHSVSGAGDVNGDGFDDLIVGGPNDGNFGPFGRNGSARVFSGSDGSVLYDFDGDLTLDGFGFSVSSAGDVNSDGVDDLIVGAPFDFNDGLGGFSGRGSARVLSGTDGTVLYNFEGDSAGDWFGYSVSGAGDVNGDGFADLIVGAQRDSNNGDRSGSARVFSGVDGSVLYTFDGDSEFDLFGSAVSGAGDVNNDGLADLIVGAYADDNNGDNSGSVRVFSGVDGSVLYDFEGVRAGDQFGRSVSAGDLNGDGYADLIVGSPIGDRFLTNRGSVWVFSGFDGSVLYNFDGPMNFSRFGHSVSNAGDTNGDGVPDFIVGARFQGANGGGYAVVFVSELTILGDCNQDHVVNFLDISPFIAILSTSGFLEQADCNQDGEVSFRDITRFIAILNGN